MATDIDGLVAKLSALSVLELAVLLGYIEDKWGITTPRGVAPTHSKEAEIASADRLVSIFITNSGTNRIQVVKAVRESLGLGLKEANDATKSAEAIASDLDLAKAEEIKVTLEKAGASIEIR
jgi:large subunit ribosomal protein L7/L12